MVHADCMMARDPVLDPANAAAGTPLVTAGEWDYCDAWVPPRCPRDIPHDALYWEQRETVDPTHNVCRYSKGCKLV